MTSSANISAAAVDAHIDELRAEVDRYLAGLAEDKLPGSLYGPVAAVLTSKGKRLRPLLTLLTAEGFGVSSSAALPGAAAVEVFHNFTLVHDDIMDQSATRRGHPTVHTAWSMPAGILAGDFLLGMAYDLLSRLPEGVVPQALACFSEMVVQLCEGQALDAEFETSNVVSVDEYMDMISRKTGALLVASLRLGGIVGSASPVQSELLTGVGYHLGLAFQIQDDLLDLTANPEGWGKPIGADLLTGKRTFLLLKAVELEDESDGVWFRPLMERAGVDESHITEARSRMEELGVLRSAESVILGQYGKALETLESLEPGVSLTGLRRIIERMQMRIR
ncbi:MAG TPA: polyprenyl synthetase family protein [Rhodothermales bacterium]|nr:polyprenyl synthetase family protein [Rhodothermales bacterium]